MKSTKIIKPTIAQLYRFNKCTALPIIPYPVAHDRLMGDGRWFVLDDKTDRQLACAADEGNYSTIYCRDVSEDTSYHFKYSKESGTRLIKAECEYGGLPDEDSIKSIIEVIKREFG